MCNFVRASILDFVTVFTYTSDTMISKERLNTIKVLSFDGDMTLWDFDCVMRHALGYTLTALRKRVPGQATEQLTIDTMIDIRNNTASELKGKIVNLEEIRYQAFRRTLQYVGSDDDAFAAILNTLYLKHRFEDIQLYPDVVRTLRTLGRYYKLGLLSNGNSYPERCGLSNTFAFTVFAQDVGVEKPDRDIFLEACRQADCTPDAMMHIGDSLQSDVYGAQQVGAIAVWLNRQRVIGDEGIIPDVVIQSLTELIRILDFHSPLQ